MRGVLFTISKWSSHRDHSHPDVIGISHKVVCKPLSFRPLLLLRRGFRAIHLKQVCLQEIENPFELEINQLFLRLV